VISEGTVTCSSAELSVHFKTLNYQLFGDFHYWLF